MAPDAPGRRHGDRPHSSGHPARSRLTAEEVRRLHPRQVGCDAWQSLVELVERGYVEVHMDAEGLVRVYPSGVRA